MPERESSLAERERKDREKADQIVQRQIRLGHIEAPKSKAKPKAKEEKEESEA